MKTTLNTKELRKMQFVYVQVRGVLFFTNSLSITSNYNACLLLVETSFELQTKYLNDFGPKPFPGLDISPGSGPGTDK